jgi:hypothetical protein
MTLKICLKLLLVTIFTQLVFCSCYSFRGASFDENLKTIQINNVRVEIAGGPTNLSLEVNEKIKEYFQRNTSLKLSSQNPDLVLEGTITGYELSPQAPTSDDKAGLNRITLKILFKLSNKYNEDKNFEQEFSFYQDFPQNQTISQVEKVLIPKMLDQIILDLFNKIAGDW